MRNLLGTLKDQRRLAGLLAVLLCCVVARAADVGCVAVFAPSGSVDSGLLVTPVCSVYNYSYSRQPEAFLVRMKIGTAYTDSSYVTGLAPLKGLRVKFRAWPAQTRGDYAVSCSTELLLDSFQKNDKATGSVSVQVKDVAPVLMSIPTPGGTYTVGTAFAPEATWRNYGNVATTAFPVWMLLNNEESTRVYSGTSYASPLAVGADCIVPWPSLCTLSSPGVWTAKCSTRYDGDLVPRNDTIIRHFTVSSADVGVLAILAPTGSIQLGDAVTPSAAVKNFGDSLASFSVFFRIDSAGSAIYQATKSVTELLPESVATVAFNTWQPPHASGDYATSCLTHLSGDVNPANDTLHSTFAVTANDSGPLTIWLSWHKRVNLDLQLTTRSDTFGPPQDSVIYPRMRDLQGDSLNHDFRAGEGPEVITVNVTPNRADSEALIRVYFKGPTRPPPPEATLATVVIRRNSVRLDSTSALLPPGYYWQVGGVHLSTGQYWLNGASNEFISK